MMPSPVAPASHLRPLWFLSEYPPNPGGIGTFARLVCELLASQGHGPHCWWAGVGPRGTLKRVWW